MALQSNSRFGTWCNIGDNKILDHLKIRVFLLKNFLINYIIGRDWW